MSGVSGEKAGPPDSVPVCPAAGPYDGAPARSSSAQSPTKERITDEALTLFSCRGFSGVSVKEIASAVGIKDSSLYKHFSTKQEIFDTILLQMTAKMDELTVRLHIADATKVDTSEYFKNLSTDALVELSERVFLFYLKDPFAARFRRMLTIEQYCRSEISDLYRKIFTRDSISYQSLLFSQLMASGVFKKGDPEIAALHFYAPLFLLLTRYDGRPEQEREALELLERHVRAFAAIYAAEAQPST